MKKTNYFQIVGKHKRLSERRRETNEEIMTQALLRRGWIDFRLFLLLKHGRAWVGYHGLNIRFKVSSIKQAREVIANLRASFEEDEDGNDKDSNR
jgi:hypothetical protein